MCNQKAKFSKYISFLELNKKHVTQKKAQEIKGMYFFLNPCKCMKYPNELKSHLREALRCVMRRRRSLARWLVLLMAMKENDCNHESKIKCFNCPHMYTLQQF